MRLRVSYKLFEALKIKTDGCTLSPVSTVDDFLGVASSFEIIFRISFLNQTCSQLLTRLFNETLIVYALIFPSNSFGFSRCTSKTCMLGERAPKSGWRAFVRAHGYFWNFFENFSKATHTLQTITQTFPL